MRRVAMLGLAKTDEADLLCLGQAPRTELDVRAALGRLENPAQRIADRLLWFHSVSPAQANTETGQSPETPLIRAAREHDEALRLFLDASDTWERKGDIEPWLLAARRWHDVISSDHYWTLTSTLEKLGAFEPAALPSEIGDLRCAADGMASEPFVVAARDALTRGDSTTAKRIVVALDELTDTGQWAATAQADIVAPTLNRLEDCCRRLREDLRPKVLHEQDAGERNKPVCDEEYKHFHDEVVPALEAVLAILPFEHDEARLSREKAARCLKEIATDYTWSDQFMVSESVLKEALRLADATLAAVQIEASLEEVSGPASRERVLEGLTPLGRDVLLELRVKCGKLREDFADKIIREENSAEQNRSVCNAKLLRFREDITPALAKVLEHVPHEHAAAIQARTDTALCLNVIATDYTWADEFIIAENLRKESAALAYGTPVATQIEERIAEIREPARQERMFRELKPISSAPSLRTINTIGFALYGNSDYDNSSQSYATTHYFVALFIPLFPVGRYRVINTGGQYRFLGKLPFRRTERWHLGIALGVLALMIIFGSLSPSQSSGPIQSSERGTASSGSVSNTNSSELADIKSRIDAGRARMETFKAQLDPVITETSTLKDQMNPLEAELKSLDERRKAGEPIDIDGYNSKVKSYNELLRRRRALLAANHNDIEAYQDLIKQDSTLVAQYNALLR
jgi:hypothetical protein